MDHNHLTIKTFMAITAERDAAIRERNMALEERKRAFAERDLAMLHRDAAIAERNSAIHERDEAIATLRYRESSMNDTISIPNSLENDQSPESAKNNQYPHQIHITKTAAYNPRGNSLNITEPSQTTKPRRGRQPKEGKITKLTKSSRVGKRVAEGSNYSNGWIIERNPLSDEEDSEKQVSWKDNLGLNQINFDDSAMPVPVCSCTGSPQPCYRWGSGGWQSACCTTTISMYPLPQMANKRYSRIGGRKMSGSAFSKLLNRLASEGHDFSTPLDLKDHWAKHGTNRYSTLK